MPYMSPGERRLYLCGWRDGVRTIATLGLSEALYSARWHFSDDSNGSRLYSHTRGYADAVLSALGQAL